MMKSNKGITLVTLVITIIILLILAAVTTTVSIKQVQSTKLEDFCTKLEIAQIRNRKNSKYK